MISVTDELVVVSCWCGIQSAVPKALYDEAKSRGQQIYCPIGHTFVYSDTKVERLEKEVAQLRDARDRAIRQRDAEQRQHAATKGQLTRARKRIAKGVCPCCNRSFVNVARHMATKHPEFPPDGE